MSEREKKPLVGLGVYVSVPPQSDDQRWLTALAAAEKGNEY